MGEEPRNPELTGQLTTSQQSLLQSCWTSGARHGFYSVRPVPRTSPQAVGDPAWERALTRGISFPGAGQEPGAKGSSAPAMISCPALRASCTPSPTSCNTCVRLFLRIWIPNCLLMFVAGIFFVIDNLVQLIYIGGAIFNTLHSTVDCLSCLLQALYVLSFSS